MTEPTQTDSHHFLVAGISLLSIRKELKPALPKKKQEASYLVVITSRASSIQVAIAGASIELPAVTNGLFVAEVPYLHFKYVLTEPFDPGALIRFELGMHWLCVNGLTLKSPEIIVKPSAAGVGPAPRAVPLGAVDAPETTPAIVNPLDATVGLPLLAAYAHIRKYGIQPFTASKTFAKQQVEVDELLKRANRLLRPVGITRADLERLLDRKVGLK